MESIWHDSDEDASCESGDPDNTELTPGADSQRKGRKEGQASQCKVQPFAMANWLVHPTGTGDSTIE